MATLTTIDLAEMIEGAPGTSLILQPGGCYVMTACGGAACQFWPVVTIAANSTYVITFNGIIVTSGVQWSCSSASVVVGQMRGAYTR